MRVVVFRLAPAEHVLVLTLHHAVSDAWSARVLAREVAALTAAFGGGLPAGLPEPVIQYADFAHWQRRSLTAEALAGQLGYWRRQLAALAPFELPADRPRREVQSLRGESVAVVLPEPLAEALRELGRRQGGTLFMTLLAAFKLLLHQRARALPRARRDDVVVGTDVANRNRLETEGLIGFFVNQLTLRTSLAGDPTFGELLARVREVALGAYAHQDLPFDHLVDELSPTRNLRRSPLFQIKFFLTHGGPATAELDGVRLRPFEIELGAAQLDLTVAFQEERGGPLLGWANYNIDLFDRSTILRLMAAFQALLQQVVAQPDARSSELEAFLTEQERELRTMEKIDLTRHGLNRLKPVSPKQAAAPAAALVKLGELHPGEPLPLVVEPALPDVDLAAWAAAHRAAIEQWLGVHGAILFRGFKIDSAPRFETFAAGVCSELFAENGEHPREAVSGHVYSPVFYPKDQKLLMHNENSFNDSWPMKILFCCVQPAEQGGETPLADSRKVYAGLSPDIVRRFEEKGVMYVRNFGQSGLGLSWETVFQTTDRSAVEEACRRSGMGFEWKGDGGLRTRVVRPAVVRHPETHEKVWFNQAQHWHSGCLNPETRASMRSIFAEGDLPRHCYFGDGSSIPDAMMEEILAVYERLEVSFAWRRGDVVLLDNVLTAHARNPFLGERKILVALGEMKSFDQVAASLEEAPAR